MNKKLFAELVESVTQMNEIVRGERAPSREFHVDALSARARPTLKALLLLAPDPRGELNLRPRGRPRRRTVKES